MTGSSGGRSHTGPGTGWLTPKDVAPILHVQPKTVTRWAKDGKLPFQWTIGGHRRYPEDEIRELAAKLHQDGEQ